MKRLGPSTCVIVCMGPSAVPSNEITIAVVYGFGLYNKTGVLGGNDNNEMLSGKEASLAKEFERIAKKFFSNTWLGLLRKEDRHCLKWNVWINILKFCYWFLFFAFIFICVNVKLSSSLSSLLLLLSMHLLLFLRLSLPCAISSLIFSVKNPGHFVRDKQCK